MVKKIEELTKEQALELAISALDKQFGVGTIITGNTPFPSVERISSGSLSLDLALSGGYARGRLVEIYGQESTGKTTLALHAIAECQKNGGKALLVDAEHALDAIYARSLGVNMEDLLISQPSNGEEGLEVLDVIVKSGAIDLAVVDSVAALVPQAELEGTMSDQQMGLQARMMSKACRKLAGTIYRTNTCVIWLNQIRSKIGPFAGKTVTGGNALKFYASQRLEIVRKGIVENSEGKTGTEALVKVQKSKVGPPFGTAELKINFGSGIDAGDDLLNIAINMNIVKRAGAWFSYGEEKLGQGTRNASEAILANPELLQLIKESVGV